MLRNSFCHIPGVGARYERRLWDRGFTSWEAALDPDRGRMMPRGLSFLGDHLFRSLAELRQQNAVYFAERLPVHEHWRLFPEFQHTVAYLDIETTGLRGSDAITTIALYDGSDIRYYVQDQNLEDFKNDISRYKLIVTYNGKCFDIPFIEQSFGVRLECAHIDLRFVLRSLGYSGGLKGCEKQLGIDRGELDGVDGYFAVLLWYDYTHNANERALETLLAYNIEDVIHLETLMVMAYNMKIRRTPFLTSHRFELPRSPRNPFNPDRATIRRIREALVSGWRY